jgi:hypothetical protein
MKTEELKHYGFTVKGQFYSSKTNGKYDSLKSATKKLREVFGKNLREVWEIS